jgi:hypothetical protein
MLTGREYSFDMLTQFPKGRMSGYSSLKYRGYSSRYKSLFNSAIKVCFHKNEFFSHLQALTWRWYFFYILTNFSVGSIVQEIQLLTHMVFFHEIHVSLQFSNITLISMKAMFLPVENVDR